MTSLRHAWLAVVVGLGLLGAGRRRALFREMYDFASRLPRLLGRPLPDAMRQIDALATDGARDDLRERDVRDLADLAALVNCRSSLGLCLRRSLTRYLFLRRRHVPVAIHFGARRVDAQSPDHVLSGHAWLTLDGEPYVEDDDRWKDFTVMLSWPTTRGDETLSR